jgi:hypothetical protein
MNKYICFWRGKQVEVAARTSLDAQNEAALRMKVKRPYEITTMLVELEDGTEVTHSTATI